MGDDEPFTVPLRPHAAQVIEQRDDVRGRYQPTLPGERATTRRTVRRLDTPAAGDESAHDLLANAWRRQELEAAAPGLRRAVFNDFEGLSLKQFGLVAGGGLLENVVADSSNAQGVAGAARPRRQKEKKEGSSMSIMDLAFASKQKFVDGEERSNYTPISLPYYEFVEEEEEAGAGTGTESKREKMVHVDEANANMAKAMPQEGEIFLLQVPSVLPELMDSSLTTKREDEDAASAGAGASITKVPDGRLGKLRIYKSGKVRMDIGGLQFAVDQGCETFFHQQVSCVCPLAKEVVNLGSISKRMVLTPDLESMLKASAPRPAGGTEGAPGAAPPGPAPDDGALPAAGPPLVADPPAATGPPAAAGTAADAGPVPIEVG